MRVDLDYLTCTKYRQGWEAERCVQLLREVVGALAYAQEQGLSRGDIQPSTLFLTDSGLYKMGCIETLDSNALAYSLPNNPLYLSPVLRRAFTQLLGQLTGQVSPNSYKSDIYSLGLISCN